MRNQIKVKNKNLIGLLIVLLLAVIFRFLFIDVLPGGLFPDEAANGLDVNQILDGKLQPFYERGNGREALFFYWLTPFVWLFGRTPLAHHAATAGLGVITVLLTYLLCRRWFNARTAFVASFLTAVSSWYVILSRTAFRANMTPVFVLLFLYFATRVVQAKTKKDYIWSSVIAGISFGGGFYTYISYRMMVPAVGIIGLLLLIIDFRSNNRWQLLKKYWKSLVYGAGAALATLAPLILFFIQKPEWIVGRSGQVSIFAKELNNGDVVGTFLEVLYLTLLSFFVHGDLNWRHNVSGFAHLSPIIAALFIGGLIFILTQALIFKYQAIKKQVSDIDEKRNLHRLPYFVIAIIFLFMLVPEILTAEGIPHGLRLIGIIPFVFIIPALFLEELLHIFNESVQKIKTRGFIKGLIAAILIIELAWGSVLYFGIAANSPGYAYAFRSDLTVVSQYLNKRNNKDQTYLVIDTFSEQTPQYMTTKTNNPYIIIDPSSLWQDPDEVRLSDPADVYQNEPRNERTGLTLQPKDQVIFTQSSLYDIKAFKQNYPEAQLIKQERNQWGEIIMEIYEINQ